MTRLDPTLRTLAIAARVLLVLTVVLGVLYPLLITGVGRLALESQANGSLVRDRSGSVVGSRLIGQSFTDADGNPLPQYFQPRPSAAADGYDAAASGGSNLGPENAQLIKAIRERKHAIAAFNHVPPSAIPPDALTASGSGLDPHISPAYAAIQVERVARARSLDPAAVRRLVAAHTHGPDWGFLGERRVNVLTLNLALDQQLAAQM
ncbi:MAG: potassium-transporting ATPase subunit KdpC [Nocardioides sp.]|nr:potassium-transporting ATPase subunit KdpC [Nocardioides sp.]